MLAKEGSQPGCCWGSKSLLLKLVGLSNTEEVQSNIEFPLLAVMDISIQREKWHLLPSRSFIRSFKLSVYLKIPNQLIYAIAPPPHTKGSVWHPPMQRQLSKAAHLFLGIPHFTQSTQTKAKVKMITSCPAEAKVSPFKSQMHLSTYLHVLIKC